MQRIVEESSTQPEDIYVAMTPDCETFDALEGSDVQSVRVAILSMSMPALAWVVNS